MEEYRIVKNNRILRVITGTVLLALFVFVLISIVRNYDPVRHTRKFPSRVRCRDAAAAGY